MASWDPVSPIDQNGIITEYEVTYQPLETFNGSIGSGSINVTAPNTSVILIGLHEYVNYNIRVRAFTSVGPSPLSPAVQERTNEDVPSRSPLITEAMEISSTEVEVTWSEVNPIDRNGIITHYEVDYQPIVPFSNPIDLSRVNTTNTTIVLRDLHESAQYNITVRAFTSIGPGPFSHPVISITHEDVPRSPPTTVAVNGVSPTTIMVSWGPVPLIDQNGIITEYEVMYQPLETFNGSIETQKVNITEPEMSVTLMELQEFVNYSISVRAYTSVGAGPYSNEGFAMTNESVPSSAPVSAVVSAISSTEIMVTWNPVSPIDQNGIITKYEVMYQPLETFRGSIETQTVNVTQSEMSMTLVGLQEFINYSVSIRAYTSVGAGPYSRERRVLTSEDAPSSSPVNMRALADSSTTIMVSWDPVPPIDQNGIITEYEVMYQPLETFNGSIVTRRVNVTEPEMSVTLMELQEFVNYSISLHAYTSVGGGPYNTPVTIATLQDVPSSSPQSVTAIATSSTSITVTWEGIPQKNKNGVIIAYEVEFTAATISVENTTVLEPPLSLELTGLYEAEIYRIRVRGYTSVGPGPFSSPLEEETPEDRPGAVGKPPAVDNDISTATSVLLQWDAPEDPNGEIVSSIINIRILSSDPLAFTMMGMGGGSRGDRRKRQVPSIRYPCINGGEDKVDFNVTAAGNSTTYFLSGLTPYTVYQFRVQSATAIGYGMFSPPRQFMTLESESTQIQDLNTTAINSSTVSVMWNSPQCPYGNITSYTVFYRLGNSIQSRNIDSSGYSSIRVYPIMGSIRHQCYIGSLIPYKNYTVHVQAVVTPHLAMQSELLGAIEEERLIQTHSAPDPDIPTPAVEVATVNPTSDSIQILIGDPKQIDTGRVILCAVVVVTLTTDSPLMSQSAYDDARAYVPDAPNPYYIAAAWDEQDVIASRVPNSFTVGNSTKDSYVVHVQGRTTTYINVPLKSDTKYSIFVRYDIYNDGNGIGKPYHIYSNNTVKKTSLPYSREGLGVGVAIVVAILLIIIIVLAIVIFKSFGRGMYEPNKSKHRMHTHGPSEGIDEKVEDKGFYSNPMMDLIHHTEPVLIEDFENHMQNLHANDNHLFTEEHALIEPNHHPSTENSRRPENIKKNRYANITTYDHSRVKLEEIAGEPGSDYINASFIDGYGTTNYFIATQGPIQDTLPDFWRMVWEQESATVVMLTNCEDNGQVKCHKYWPEEPDTPEMHGCIKVTLLKSCVLAGYTIRTFSLQMERAERTIQHFHFTSWPDNCVPESPAPFLHFVQEVTQNKAGPMVVHCSDGVGRTGVFIALHSQLLRIRDEGTVDIFNFVQSMRKKRCFMVQTEPEYIFLHDALLEAIEHGETQQSTL